MSLYNRYMRSSCRRDCFHKRGNWLVLNCEVRTLQTGIFVYHILDRACPLSLYRIIKKKQIAMASLESEVQRLARAMSIRASGIEKREHPLEPCIHIVDDRGTKGTHIGRHASMVCCCILLTLCLKTCHISCVIT